LIPLGPDMGSEFGVRDSTRGRYDYDVACAASDLMCEPVNP
jgi:hypothetical protein